MEKTDKRIQLDQFIFAIPAAMYIITPLLEIIFNFFRSIMDKIEYETFKVIPYLPAVLTGILVLSLFLFYIFSEDRNIFRVAYRRTATFQVPLVLFMLFLGLILMSLGANGFSYFALHGHSYTKMSMWTYIANILLYLVITSFIYDQRVKSFLVKMCCYIGAAYALYSVIAYISEPYNGSLRGTFHNSNHYGYYLAVTVSLTSAVLIDLMNKKSEEDKSGKIIDISIWGILLIVQCVALAYNNTLGAWLAVLFVYIFLFIVSKFKEGRFDFKILIIVGVFMFISVISSLFTNSIFTSIIRTYYDVGKIVTGAENAGNAGSGRWKIWQATVRHILEYPIFGNNIEGLLFIHYLENISTGSPHNEFLEYTAFFGIPAGLSYIAACVSVFIHGFKYRKELNSITLICMAGAFGYLVSSFFGVCFYYTVTYPFIFLGLSLNFAKKDDPTAVKESENEISETDEQSEPVQDQIPEDLDTSEENVEVEKEDQDKDPQEDSAEINSTSEQEQ